ncbi:uncharacterized protein LOC131858474 [Cryptomeria japonica]|uniref:uncharacterized protein LOC131858474 n=1 Tax=Cryptomeria japonica TaxID=3369 RepID=UPI0027DA9F1F|nr:uncharacterized protein LOC131858474 [Cryptomeria japonica]
MNSVPSAAIHAAYWMIKENGDYDLCEAMQSQLMLNLESIKKDNNQKFKFGQILIVTTNFYLMEAAEPREEEMEQISYEVSYDLLISYANNLLASPKDTKKKRLGIYQEIIAQAQPNDVKEKKKKDDQVVSMLTSTSVISSAQSKKESKPKVYAKKLTATRKRGRYLILQEEYEEIESEEDKKKLTKTSRKPKPIGEIPKQNIPIDIASFKPMKLLEMLSKHKGQFHTRARRLRLLEGKIQVVEDDTHQDAKNVLRMNEQLKNYHNKLGQTEIGVPLELETEEILLPDEIYTDKDKNDTNSPPVIFFIDDTHDTINTTGTNNELDKEKEQELGKGTKEVEKEKDQEKDKELVTTYEEWAKKEKMKIKKEKEVLQTTIDVLSNLLPDVDILGILNPIKQLDILCTSVTDQVNTLEETTQVLQESFLHTDAIIATLEMSTLDAMEELAFQIRTQLEIIAMLLETWSIDLIIVQKEFKSVFDKLS